MKVSSSTVLLLQICTNGILASKSFIKAEQGNLTTKESQLLFAKSVSFQVSIHLFDINIARTKPRAKTTFISALNYDWESHFSPSSPPRSSVDARQEKALFKPFLKMEQNIIMRTSRRKKTWNDKILENWIQQKTRFLLAMPIFLHYFITLDFFCSSLRSSFARVVFASINFHESIGDINMHASWNAIYSRLSFEPFVSRDTAEKGHETLILA